MTSHLNDTTPCVYHQIQEEQSTPGEQQQASPMAMKNYRHLHPGKGSQAALNKYINNRQKEHQFQLDQEDEH